MTTHDKTPLLPSYHDPAYVPARKPVPQYDGAPDLQRAPTTTTSRPSASNQASSNFVPTPDRHAHKGNKLSRPANAIARGLAREAGKKKSKEHKESKKSQLREEKARKRWLGGVAWGFDPTAGMISSKKANESDGGAYVIAGRSLQGFEGTDELDEVGRRTGRRWVTHNLWGIERGGPGNEGRLGHGALRTRGPSLDRPAQTLRRG